MAYIVNLYKNLAGDISTPIIPGVAAFTGDLNDLSNWTNYGRPYITMGDEYDIYISQSTQYLRKHFNNITLSGGQYITDASFPETVPDSSYYDTQANNSSAKIYNPQFAGAVCYESAVARYYLCIQIFSEPAAIDRRVAINFRIYTQSPNAVPFENRSTWNYQPQLWNIITNCKYSDNNHRQTRLYKCTVGGRDFYALFAGVSGAGTIDTGATGSNGTTCYLIPAVYFTDAEPRPWTGQETESNSENAYTPTTPYRGSVLPRDLTNKRNPYGFNSGNGLTLAVITFEEYAAILQGIYAGSAESVLNKLAQGWSTIVGGNTHRPADEVQAITNAILACHMIPQLTGYVSGSMTLRTIAGYHILGGNANESVTLSLWTTQNTIFEFETSTYYIQRRLNSFLDFEPYTTIILHLPFMPTVDIKPSILYGNGLKIHYKIDIFTGVLSADIIIVDNGGTSQDTPREFILTTLQTNVKTDIPIMGNAAQSGMFSSLTNALVSSVGAESYGGLVAGGIGAADMFSKMSTGQAVGQSKIDGIGAYLSNRQPYLIITRPNPANPPNYNQLAGIPSHMGGKVGDYFRTNNSQNLQYTEFAAVDLSEIAATDQEKAEIENLLKSGVFI